jgi:hypothetical protein
MVTLLSSQEDYSITKQNIESNKYSTYSERKYALEELKKRMDYGGDGTWPLDNTNNRQAWLITVADLFLWLCFHVYICQRPRENRTLTFIPMRISTSSSEDSDISSEA